MGTGTAPRVSIEVGAHSDMHALAKKLLALFGSTVLTLLVLELGVRIVVDVTDDLKYELLPSVGLRLVPGQEGKHRADPVDGGPAVHTRFRVNNAGFNNWRDYHETPRVDTHRIAVVGDSFIEALQVDFDRSIAYFLEQRLMEHSVPTEVYSFGISGYGTAQIYHLLDSCVLKYNPDFVVYLFVPNDVEDSSPFGRRNPWYQQYELGANGELVALPMQSYRLPIHRRILKNSALFRYLYYQKHWGARVQGWKTAGDRPPTLEPVSIATDERRAWATVEQLLIRIDRLLDEAGVPWLLMWQATADPDYMSGRRSQLEAIVERNGIPYLDPTSRFSDDYQRHQRPHSILGDGHWSEDGHRVAGEAVAAWIATEIESGTLAWNQSPD